MEKVEVGEGRVVCRREERKRKKAVYDWSFSDAKQLACHVLMTISASFMTQPRQVLLSLDPVI